jgi:hypothetical protein
MTITRRLVGQHGATFTNAVSSKHTLVVFPSIFSLDSLPLTCLHMQRRGDEVYRAAFASSCSRRKNQSNIFFSFLFVSFFRDRPTDRPTTFQVRLDPSLLSESFVHFDGQIRSQSSVTQSNMFISFLLNTIKLDVWCLWPRYVPPYFNIPLLQVNQ